MDDLPNAALLERSELARTLRWMADLVEADDSAEAHIAYAWSEHPGTYQVYAGIRFGNSLGQGSMRLINSTFQ